MCTRQNLSLQTKGSLMIDLANWIAQDAKHFVGTLAFVVGGETWCVCLVNSALRGTFDSAL
jgi:hypothetical protein